MNFWKNFKKIFSPTEPLAKKAEGKQSSPNLKEELLEHKVIERNAAEKAYFEQWNNSNVKIQMLEWISQQFQNYQNRCCCDCAISFLIIPSVNGFVIHYNEEKWRSEDFKCLLDYFKVALRKEQYWSHVSDTKTTRKGELIETVERHYLKPARQFGLEYGEKMDQKFGNIMVTLNQVNGKIINLKLSATHYNDHLYHPAQGFNELIELLCTAKAL